MRLLLLVLTPSRAINPVNLCVCEWSRHRVTMEDAQMRARRCCKDDELIWAKMLPDNDNSVAQTSRQNPAVYAKKHDRQTSAL